MPQGSNRQPTTLDRVEQAGERLQPAKRKIPHRQLCSKCGARLTLKELAVPRTKYWDIWRWVDFPICRLCIWEEKIWKLLHGWRVGEV